MLRKVGGLEPFKRPKAHSINAVPAHIFPDAIFQVSTYIRDLGGGFLDIFREHLNSNTPFHPYSKVYPQVRERVGQAVNEVIVGAKTAEQACQEAQKDVDQIMRKGGFY